MSTRDQGTYGPSGPGTHVANGHVADARLSNGRTDPDVLRADIADTRAALAATAGELAGRLDVPAQVRARVRERLPRLVERTRAIGGPVLAAAGAAVGVVLTAWLIRSLRRR